jgi:hypothetical protein
MPYMQFSCVKLIERAVGLNKTASCYLHGKRDCHVTSTKTNYYQQFFLVVYTNQFVS